MLCELWQQYIEHGDVEEKRKYMQDMYDQIPLDYKYLKEEEFPLGTLMQHIDDVDSPCVVVGYDIPRREGTIEGILIVPESELSNYLEQGPGEYEGSWTTICCNCLKNNIAFKVKTH